MKAGIAGAGILGRLLALELLKAGWSVTLFDQQQNIEMDNCSMAAAGLLTPVTELEKCGEEIYALGIDAVKLYWPEIVSVLRIPDAFQHKGSVMLAHPNDESEKKRLLDIINHRLPEQNKTLSLNQAGILDLEPDLNKWHDAFYFPDEGCLDNHLVMEKLGEYLDQQGVDFHLGEAILDVLPYKLQTQTKTYQFDKVFDCRGMGAKKIFPDLRGIRGEAITLYAPEVNITRPVRLLNPKYSLYIVPKPDHHYVLGASEIETEDNSEISVRTTLELLSSAYYVHPGFAEARVIKTTTQLRPALSDHMPKIKYTDGFIAINGLYRHGFLIAPSLVNEVMGYLTKEVTSKYWEEMYASDLV